MKSAFLGMIWIEGIKSAFYHYLPKVERGIEFEYPFYARIPVSETILSK